jgi:large subunit ribosomal protein L11
MAGKKIKTVIKINLKAGEATPAPPLGTALGPQGIAIMDFVKQYNEKTKDMKGNVVPAVITIYEDRTFTFITKLAPVSEMIKKELGLEKGSGATPKEMVGALTDAQLTKIATEKLKDLNTKNVDAAKKIVAGTARSMGIQVEGVK